MYRREVGKQVDVRYRLIYYHFPLFYTFSLHVHLSILHATLQTGYLKVLLEFVWRTRWVHGLGVIALAMS